MKILRRTFIALTAAYWLFALLMTHLPKPPALGPSMGDKGQHVAGYGLLAGMLYLTIWICRPTTRWIGLYVILTVLAYGAIDEWTQPWAGRTCDFGDWLSDLAGVVVAVGLLAGAKWFWRGRREVRGGFQEVEADPSSGETIASVRVTR
ncbi:MAG: VanZ family protein [Bacillota bacterium]